jgi:hypothetical protein
MQIFDEALAGSAPTDLHNAIAEAPAMVDSTNHYATNGAVVFPAINQRTPDIAALFIELASVMSGQDDGSSPDGKVHHAWRVYCSGGCFQPQAGP